MQVILILLVYSLLLCQNVQRVLSNDHVTKFATFNTALLENTPSKKERLAALPKALRKLDVDVVCLQEVFLGREVIEIVEKVRSIYPYSYSSLHGDKTVPEASDISRAPCSLMSSLSTLFCFALRCKIKDSTSDESIACAENRCSYGSKFSVECMICMGSSGPSPTAIIRNCLLYTTTAFNTPGLLTLSKTPLRNNFHKQFIPGLKPVPRSLLQSDVDGFGTVMCTHLTANWKLPFFDSKTKERFRVWSAVNAFEVDSIIDFSKDKSKIVLLGDLNTGPSISDNNIVSEFKDSYPKLLSSGFVSPYVTTVGKKTFRKKSGIVIDHVMHRGYTVQLARRIFEDDNYVDGVPLSDHYGVEVWLS